MDKEQQNINIVVFLQRRKAYILLPFCISLLLFTAVTVLLPSVYTSTATILIEGQEVPDDLVHSTVTGFVEERLRSLKQVVLSRDSLAGIIRDMRLYQRLAGNYSEQELVDKMRKDIIVEPIQAEVVDMRTGRSATATVAFSLSYDSRDPKTAASVAETLVQLFLQENIQTRESKAWLTYNFLERRLDELQADILQSENEIARFKEQHLRSLPELMDLNLRTIETIQKDMEIKQVQLQAARDRLIFLHGQMATLDPSTPFISKDMPKAMTVEDQLKSLRSQYISLKAAHSDKHPDVIRLRREIAALEQVASTKNQLSELYKQLEDREHKRVLALKNYLPQHPSILTLEEEIAAIKKEIGGISRDGSPTPKTAEAPDNPVYISLLTQVESARLEIRNLTSLLRELEDKYANYQQLIEKTPQVEQNFQALQRHYESIQTEHKDTFNRLQAARESVGMEEQQMGERFTVTEPPQVPESPSKPNRPVLFVLGLIFSLGLGGLVGVVTEHLDHSVHSTVELMEITGRPALGMVPYLESPRERRMRKSQRRIGLVLAVVTVVIALVMIHLLYVPLDDVWRRGIKFLNFLV